MTGAVLYITSCLTCLAVGVAIGWQEHHGYLTTRTLRTRLAALLRRRHAAAADDLMAVADTLPARTPQPAREPARPELNARDLAYLTRIDAHISAEHDGVRDLGQSLADRVRTLGVDARDPALGRVLLVVLASAAKLLGDCDRAGSGLEQSVSLLLDVLAAAALDLTEFERATAAGHGP